MEAGLGVLGLAPAALWTMTPRELSAALRGRLGPQPEAPPSRGELAALLTLYPDR